MDQWMLAMTLAQLLRIGYRLEVASSALVQLPFFHSLLLFTMYSFLACLF